MNMRKSTYPILTSGLTRDATTRQTSRPTLRWSRISSRKGRASLSLANKIASLPTELRHRIYHLTIMDEDVAKPRNPRAEPSCRPIGLARRFNPPPLANYDGDGIINYYSQSEYFNLVYLSKALFALDCSSLDEDEARTSNNAFGTEQGMRSLYADFVAWFWHVTILDLTCESSIVGLPTRSLLWLGIHHEYYPQIQHITLKLNATAPSAEGTDPNERDLIRLCGLIAARLPALKTVILFTKITYTRLRNISLEPHKCVWAKAVRMLKVDREGHLDLQLTVHAWPEAMPASHKAVLGGRGLEFLRELTMPDSLRERASESAEDVAEM